MFGLLKAFECFSLTTSPLTTAEFDAIADEFSEDLSAYVDETCKNTSSDAVIEMLSEGLSQELTARLLPIAVALVAAATRRPRAETESYDFVTVAVTTIKIIRERFPAPDAGTSLRAAVNYLVTRVALQSNATTPNTSVQ